MKRQTLAKLILIFISTGCFSQEFATYTNATPSEHLLSASYEVAKVEKSTPKVSPTPYTGVGKGYKFDFGMAPLQGGIEMIESGHMIVATTNKDPNASSRDAIAVVDLSTGKRTLLPYSIARPMLSNVYENSGFHEGYAIVAKHAAKETEGSDAAYGHTYINAKGEALTPPKFIYASRFRNGLAGVTYYENGSMYSGVIGTDGEIKFAVYGDYIVDVGNGYVSFDSKSNGSFCYDYDGNRIPFIPHEERIELNYPGYNESEKDTFMSNHASSYDGYDIQYAGSNRFILTKDYSSTVVDSKNKTIFKSEDFLNPLYNEKKLYFSTSDGNGNGVVDINGKVILNNEWSIISPANGDMFAAIYDNSKQILVDNTGKTLVSSPSDPIYFLTGSVVMGLRDYYMIDYVPPTAQAYLYTTSDLSKKGSTAEMKNLLAKPHPTTNELFYPMAKRAYSDAKKIAGNSTWNILEMYSVYSEVELFFD